MAEDRFAERLKRLENRIDAAKSARAERPLRGQSEHAQSSLAWRMVTELVAGMMLGVAIGWGLDSLFGTLPVFLMLFALLGFAAGVRTMMRTAGEVQGKRAEGALLRRDADKGSGGPDERGRDGG